MKTYKPEGWLSRMMPKSKLSPSFLYEAKESGEICFIIGSSYGLSPEVKSACRLRLSFSKLTFPHQLMRVILYEAVYRCTTIIKGTRYHKWPSEIFRTGRHKTLTLPMKRHIMIVEGESYPLPIHNVLGGSIWTTVFATFSTITTGSGSFLSSCSLPAAAVAEKRIVGWNTTQY